MNNYKPRLTPAVQKRKNGFPPLPPQLPAGPSTRPTAPNQIRLTKNSVAPKISRYRPESHHPPYKKPTSRELIREPSRNPSRRVCVFPTLRLAHDPVIGDIRQCSDPDEPPGIALLEPELLRRPLQTPKTPMLAGQAACSPASL